MESKRGLLSGEGLTAIGTACFGTHWMADMARIIEFSKSAITRAMWFDPLHPHADERARPPKALFVQNLRTMMIDRLAGIATLMTTPGLPHYDAVKTKQAQKLINEGIALLRSQQQQARKAA